LQPNKDGNSALDVLIINNSDDKIIEVLKALKKVNYSKVELKDLLTAKNSNGNSAITLLASKKKIDSIIEIINEFDGENPEERRLLKEILLQPNKDGNYALDLLIINNSDDKIIEVLKALKSKFSKDDLKDLLTTQNDRKSGDSAIILLAFTKKIGPILEIINEFDGEKPEERRLLKEILLQPNRNGDFALDFLIDNNPDDKIIEVLKALKKVNYSKVELKDLLTAKNSNGNSAIILLASKKKIDSILEIINEFDGEKPGESRLLKEILLQPNKDGNYALYYLIDRMSNNSTLKYIKKIGPIFSDEEIQELLHKKAVEDRKILPILTLLILAGNDRVIEEILNRDIEIKIDELPSSYYANIPNVAVYYLEAFRKDPNNQIKEIKYYNSDNKDGVDILNLRLNDDREDPLIVEIIGTDNSSRKVIITEAFIENSKNKINGTNLNLQNTFQLAESDKIDQIIINLNIYYYAYLKYSSSYSNHEITIKLTKSEDGWDVVYHDPNSIKKKGFSRTEEWKQTNEKAIREICEQNNIKINSITEHENIIANDSEGSCDIIASIVGASMIIGDDHSKKLAQKCQEYFSYDKDDRTQILSLDGCIRHIGGDTLNKEVKSILEDKVELIKSKMVKSPSSKISPEGGRSAQMTDDIKLEI
jgi:uncharacterized membrane protein